ncbi:MAG: rhodanese-like domain-containing protein, partial [bacterium]
DQMSNKFLFLSIVVVLAYIIYNKVKKSFAMKNISANLKQGEQITFLDVRTKKEFEGFSVTNSINVPVSDIQNKIQKIIPNKETNITVYCQSGARSLIAHRILKNCGYKNVTNIGTVHNAAKLKEKRESA